MNNDNFDFLKPYIEPLLGFSQILRQDPDWMLLCIGSILANTRLKGVGRTMQLFAIVHQFDQRYMPLVQKTVEINDKSLGAYARTRDDFVSKLSDFVQLMAEQNGR